MLSRCWAEFDQIREHKYARSTNSGPSSTTPDLSSTTDPTWTTLLTTRNDPGPDPPQEPPRDAGTPTATSNCAIFSDVPENAPKEPLSRSKTPAQWSELGEAWPELHGLMWGIRKSGFRRPSVAHEGGLVREDPSFRDRVLRQEGRLRGVVKMGPLMRNSLDDPSP